MKQRQPKVSVIVLTYNQADSIARALDSVLAQQCDFDYEVVVADDCSTDDTPAICRRYAEREPERIRLLESTANKGLVDNYFDALSDCRGEYIADCAGDDFWLGTDRLQRLHDALDGHPELTLVHSRWMNRDAATGQLTPGDPDGRNDDLHAPVESGRKLMVELLRQRSPAVVHLSTALYRRPSAMELLSRHGEVVRNCEFACEDLPLLSALMAVGDVGFVDFPSLAYTVGHDSLSSSYADRPRVADFYLRTALASIKIARYWGVPIAYLKQTLAEKMRFVMALAFQSADRSLRDRIETARQRNGIPVEWHYRLLKALTSAPRLWQIARTIDAFRRRGA